MGSMLIAGASGEGEPRPAPSRRRASGRVVLALGLVGGILSWASFFVPILSWCCLVPWGLLVLIDADRRSTYGSAWLGGCALFLPGTYWVSYCAPWVWIGWLVLSMYLACYVPAFVFLTRVCHRQWKVPMLFTMPLVWVALEYLRMYALSGFGWLMLAHSVTGWERVIQIADVAGVYGVSFVLAMGNAFLIELLTVRLVQQTAAGPRMSPEIFWRMATAGLVVFLNVGYGQWRIAEYDPKPGPKVVIIQTNVSQESRNDQDLSEDVFDEVWPVATPAGEIKADFIVWPETSYPYPYGICEEGLTPTEISKRYLERTTAPGRPLREPPTEKMGEIIRANFRDGDEHTTSMARALGMPMLLGTSHWDIRLSGAELTNSSALITADRGEVARYAKTHLLPFGEYIPLGGNIPFLAYLLPYPADMNYDSDPGTGPVPIEVGDWLLAPLICFEDTRPDITREYVRLPGKKKPVDILVNQSNDAWFRGSIEGPYHVAASVFRCVEVRRPMVRSSNAGPSNLIDACGRVTKQFEKDGRSRLVSGLLTVDVPLDQRETWYVKLGDWLPMLGWVLIGGCLTFSFGRIIVRRG